MINYEKELNQEQLDVVHGGDGPCLVLAGAGSGKTRTIVYRIAYLLEKGVDPKNIMLVTFTNKAAREMISRVESLLHTRPKGLVAGTFHQVANMLLRRYGKRIGLESNFTIIDEDDKKTLIKASLGEAGIDIKKRRFPSPAVLKEIFSYTKNSRGSLEGVLEFKHSKFLEIKTEITAVRRIYEQKKRDGNMVDFDDLLSHTLELLETQEDIKNALAHTFKYVLVDEYQDINPIQAAILYHLSGYYKNILVVGDDAQSIYSFRAADIKNILDFNKTYNDAKVFKLEINYRSTPDILSLANNIISNNINQFPKNLKAICDRGDVPNLLSAGSANDEARFIADKILQLRDQGIELKDMAVLFRASYHSQALELELTKRDIPYDYRGGVKFFERAHIKDVIAYLRIFHNIKDEAAWMRILSFGVGIGPATAKKIFIKLSSAINKEAIPSFDMSSIGNKAQVGLEELFTLWRKLLSVKYKPAPLISQILSSYYKDYMESQYTNYDERLSDLQEFINYSSKYDDMDRFLSEITLYEDVAVKRDEVRDYEDEKMILSTIHQSKGLEWNTVFIINLVEGGFPNRRALLEDGGVEEERRLFYVACTRAKKNLFLSHSFAGSSGGYTGTGSGMMFNEPSMFLREIDEFLLNRVDGFEDSDSLPVIDINGEEIKNHKPRTSFLSDINIDF